MSTEKLMKTGNERIFVFKSEFFDIIRFKEDFDKLHDCLLKRNLDSIFSQIKKLVPTYTKSDYVTELQLVSEPDGGTELVYPGSDMRVIPS